MIMVGLNKMESKKYGSCDFCQGNSASTTCDRTKKQICPSCVIIKVVSAGVIEVRGAKK
jgi:hypothetical protein